MSYKKIKDILPSELITMIQEYIDGEYIYIPIKQDNKKSWGASTSTRKELKLRNSDIYNDYLSGINTLDLAKRYYLSAKSIQRIIRAEKSKDKIF
ncbi:CD3324 family protein [Oceanobacillus neutriphilus]|uniref:Mor transcription activator domain-containing protein n=1 Tax=Oceanobacillus neutriphilus TaxID=531815 RepID=A0ABQ2P0R5_9BACI|nr:CD3324 family protein [Oceanobacillus neutriphilus]GGP15218.1 hypothetical protein GCM10011346_42350 [Oceanobacillus neutriphilus]